MDFMKVIDQTVREIKREVNLKVLHIPEIEQKVLDATDDEPWGPHGTVLAEIAQATKKFSECQMVMGILWTRLSETGRNWRYVYKSLAVIEYLVANGSERAVDDIIEHTFQISALSSFEYVEPNGKDMGINVRKKAENIVALLNNKDKIQEVRDKAAATRDKYFGLSSTGITYKSGSASLGYGSSRCGDGYGGFSYTRDGTDSFSGSYKDRDRFGEDKFEKSTSKPRRGVAADNQENTSKGSTPYGRSWVTSASKPVTKITKQASMPSQNSIPPKSQYDDDFDPRGTSSSKSTAGSSHEVDLFANFMDAPAPVPKQNPTVSSISSEVDLFANATFVSASPSADVGTSVDLFASQPTSSAVSSTTDFFDAADAVTTQVVGPPTSQPENKTSSSAVSSTTDFFAAPDPMTTKVVFPFVSEPDNKSEPEQVTIKTVDPFATVSSNTFDGSNLFGSVSSHSDSLSKEPSQNFLEDANPNNLNEKSQAESKTPSKDSFQVKSGIWADSLSRGLIDLNISASKKVNLADVGVVGLKETEETSQAPSTSYYMGRAMGTGSGLGRSDLPPSAPAGTDMFANFSG